jgi:hypothetical protein
MHLSHILDEHDSVRETVRAAEDALYADPSNPLFAWNDATLAEKLQEAGFKADITVQAIDEQRRITLSDIDRWLDPVQSPYGRILTVSLAPEDLERYRKSLEKATRNGPVRWKYEILYCSVL